MKKKEDKIENIEEVKEEVKKGKTRGDPYICVD